MVEFLLNASTTLIESISGEGYDVEGVNDCPCVWEFFGGGALGTGESIRCDDLNALTPRVGAEASQVLKICLERPETMSRSREGPRRSWMGVKSKMTVTYLTP